MIRPVNRLDEYRYAVSDITLMADGWLEPIVVEAIQVVSITIIKKYETDIQPFIYISMNIARENYEKVITSMKTLTADITIYKSKEMPDGNTVTYEEPVVSKKFKAFNKDMMDTRVSNQLNASITATTNTTNTSAELNLFLYDHSANINFRKNQSVNIYGTMNDAIFMCMNDRGFDNILMSPAEYETRQIVSPVGTLGHNLDSLNDVYGIYDAPRIFFADFDCTYLLDKGKIGQTLRRDEMSTVNIYLEKSDDNSSINTGCYIDTENGYYILNATPFTVNDTDTMSDFVMGGVAKTVIAGSETEYVNTVGDYEVETTLRAHHKKAHNQMLYRINQTKRTIPIEFSDIDISIITPNKRYVLIVDQSYDSQYNIKGNYRLIQSVVVLARKSERVFKSVTQCTFSKI